MQFYQLAVGARFEVFSRQYAKVGMSLADDHERVGAVFDGRTEVTSVGEPLLLPVEEAE